jgi:TonB family protein
MRKIAVLLAALVMAEAFAAHALTWQEANRQSAAALRSGDERKGTELARRAFELYSAQSPNYRIEHHGQLLLNLVGARSQATGWRDSLKELESGVSQIRAKAGDQPGLLPLWDEAIKISKAHSEHALADHYYTRALKLASHLWGDDDARTITLALRRIADLYSEKGFDWSRSEFMRLRPLAERRGHRHLVATIDLNLAAIEAVYVGHRESIPAYRKLIADLEAESALELRAVLQQAYAALEQAYRKVGDEAEAAETHRHLVATFGGKLDELVPLARAQPEYPKAAAVRGIGGSVTLKLSIAADGKVRDATIVSSDPPGVFDQAALAAVRKWQFSPKVMGGQPVEAEGLQLIEFKMWPGGPDSRSIYRPR